jgi:hypothetical protein
MSAVRDPRVSLSLRCIDRNACVCILAICILIVRPFEQFLHGVL